jgi:hypothetical protein
MKLVKKSRLKAGDYALLTSTKNNKMFFGCKYLTLILTDSRFIAYPLYERMKVYSTLYENRGKVISLSKYTETNKSWHWYRLTNDKEIQKYLNLAVMYTL